ncbi:MAG: SRPBCC family protein [Proteobacteria bacterium]|nr:SRPBCC family protein [Pseudomonadota bacterium]
MSNQVKLHRVFKAPVERVYRAFTDPDALTYWMSPFGFLGKVHSMDLRVGGTFKMSFINFTDNKSHSFGGKYLEIKPNLLLRYTDVFDDPNLPGEIQMKIEFKEVVCGTEIRITQDNLPDMIPVEMCYLGWQDSLIQLAHLVEPEIKQ